MLDDIELKLLSDLQHWAPDQTTSNSAGVGEILGRNLVNLPSRAGSSLMESFNALANLGAPEAERPKAFKIPDIVDPPKLDAGASMSQRLTDVVSGTVAPEIAALLVPYLGISKVAKVAGMGEMGAALLANLGQGAIGGAKYGPEEAARFALTGAAVTPISTVIGPLKRLGLSLPVAGADFAVSKAMGKSDAEAGTGAAVDVLAGMIPMKISRIQPHTIDPALAKVEKLKEIYREINAVKSDLNPNIQKQKYLEQLNAEIASLQTETGLTNEAAKNINIQEELAGMMVRGRGEPSLLSPMAPINPPIPLPKGQQPLAPPMMPRVKAPEPLPTIQFDEAGTQALVQQRAAETQAEEAALQDLRNIKLTKAKSKIPGLPEFMRTQGGFTADDSELFKTLLSSGLGGFAGGAVGGAVTGDETGIGIGAAIGLAAPWGIKALQAGKGGAIHEIIPAIKVEGQIIRGVKGETHQDILKRFIQERPDKAAEALVGFDAPDNPNFFLKGRTPISRGELKDTFGVSDSQGLARLQTEGYSFPKGEAGSIPAGGKGKYEQNQKGLNKFAKDIEDRVTETIKKIPRTDLQRGDTVWLPSGRRAEFVSDSIPDKKTSRRRVIVKYTIGNGDEVTTHAWLDTVTLENPRPPIAKQNEIASLQKGNIEKQNAQPAAAAPKPTVHETPEFKQWFGESKVVDEQGKPIVVYYGTQNAGFTTFLTSHFGSKKQANRLLENRDITKNAAHAEDLPYFGTKNAIYPTYLRIENPKRVKDVGSSFEWDKEIILAKSQGHDGLVYFNQVEGKGWSYVPFNPNQIKSATGNSGAFSLKSNDITGSINRELLLPLAGAGIGAATGYEEKGTEGAIAGAILGGVAGIGLGRGIDAIERIAPKLATPSKESVETAKNLTDKSFKGVQKALNKPFKDLAGEDVEGRGGIISKLFRVLEDQFSLNQPDELKTAITRARGFPSEIVDRSNMSLLEAIKYSPPAEISKVTNTFLEGRMLTPKEELTFLQLNGAIDEAAYKKLNRVQRGNYTYWSVKDTDLQGKAVIKKWYVNTDIRDSFLSMQEKAYLQAVPEDWRMFANLQISARRGMNDFQKIIADALPEGRLKELVEDSLGRYIPRMYRIFTDPKYKPTDKQIESAMQEFGISRANREIQDAAAISKAATSENYNKKIIEYRKRNDLQAQGRLATLQKFEPVTVNGEKYFAAPEIAESLKKFSNEDYLRKEVHNYLHEISANRQLIGGGRGIDKTMFKEREEIGPAYRDMLGEYTDPIERMAMGVQRMYGSAQSAKLVSMTRDMKVDGFSAAMSDDVWSATNMQLKDAIKASTNPTEIASLQSQLDTINSYKKIPTDIKFAEYSGLYVNRFVADYFTDNNRMWDTSLGRHMAEFNRYFKTAHIPLNPVSQLRQIVSTPLFMAIGRATPAAFGQATRAYRNILPEMRTELLREGIWTADFIRGELRGTTTSILNGRYDSALVKTLRKGYEAVLEAYRVPDMLVRGATYLAAKNRIALKTGKAIDHPEVIQAAVQWTDRYTMNYDNISKFVRGVRNVPFVNPFVSFQAEMLRIMKNFVVDSAKGDMERLATFGGLVSVPFMLAAAGESSLKPEDQKEWAKTKAFLPAYMREQSLIPIARLQNGKFKYVAISPIIPQDNFEQSVKAMVKGDMEALAAVNPFISRNSSPLFNMISELVSGEDKQTGLKFRSNTEALTNVLSDILPPLSPGGYEWKRLANVGVENLRTGRVEDWGDIALRYTTGLGAGVLKPEAVERGAVSKFKRDVADLKYHYSRIASTTVDQKTKDEAYQQFREGTKILLQEFAERYGGSLSPSAQRK